MINTEYQTNGEWREVDFQNESPLDNIKTKRKRPHVEAITRSAYLQDSEYAACLQYCKQHEHEFKWRMPCRLFRFIMGCGLRVSEAANLIIPADIQYDGMIYVRNGKGGRARQVMASPELVPFLQKWLEETNGTPQYLFHKRDITKPVSRHILHNWWESVLKASGVTRKLSIHKGRHSYATWELATRRLDIGEVAAQLGDSIQIANEFYRGATQESFNQRASDPNWEPEWRKEWKEGATNV